MIRISKIDTGDLRKQALSLSQKVQQNVAEKAIRWAVHPTVERIKQLAPADTHALRASIGVRHKYYKRGGLWYSVIGPRNGKYDTPKGVKEPAYYAYLVEFGHLPKGAGRLSEKTRESMRKGAAKHPFMRPAWEQTREEVLERLKSKFSEELKVAIQRTSNSRRRRAA